MIRRNKQRGSAMVEFALILPVFLLLAVGGMCMLMAWNTYGNVGYIAQQVAQCRANYLLGGAAAAGSQCPGAGNGAATTYANTLGTGMNVNAFNVNSGASLTVTETTGTPCAGCIQEQVSYPFTPFAALIPAIAMNETAIAAVTMYSGTTSPVQAIAGTCVASLPVSVPGVTASMVATASPANNPADPNLTWEAYVSAPGTVTVNVCSPVADPFGGGISTAYNVRVVP